MSNQVKITVLKKTIQEDLFSYRQNPGDPPVASCPHFEVGQSFVCTTNNLPVGFCAWAFGDIAKDFALVAYDSTKTAIKITCCTSGLHNVYFRIEAI